jgi:hypothetical protein
MLIKPEVDKLLSIKAMAQEQPVITMSEEQKTEAKKKFIDWFAFELVKIVIEHPERIKNYVITQ